jgi:cytochrome c biogenesis protein CcmG, thiol:disulfide interchange protein DsbE
MKPWQVGALACAIAFVLMYLGWSRYETFLKSGSRPTEGTRVLNEIEKTGVPNIRTTDINGAAVDLSLLHDKVVIVNFWASWCKPCLEEFPSMLSLLDQLGPSVVILAVSHDFNMDDIRSFLTSFSADGRQNFITVWDKDKSIAKSFGTTVLPESFIVGKGGVLVRKVTGVEDWASADALQFFKDLVKGKY